MRVLGLDPALAFGWAVLEDGRLVDGGVWEFHGLTEGGRLCMLLERLNAKARVMRVDCVAFESARHKPIKGAWQSLCVRSELIAVVKMWCEESAVSWLALGIEEVKRHASGDSFASKELMGREARHRWPGLPEGVPDDVVDALWVADLGAKVMGRVPLNRDVADE